MGTTTKFTYFLPTTKVRLRCLVTTLTDTIPDPNESATSSSDWSAELVTVADLDQRRTLVVESGFWRDYALTLGLTEDGRLTQAGVETTGQVGRVLVGALTTVVGVAALLAGQSQPVRIASVVRSPGASGDQQEAARAAPDQSVRAKLVASKYQEAYPEESARLAELAAERARTVSAVDSARAAYLAADGSSTASARRVYRAAKEVLADVDAELEDAKAHFAAWRKTTITQTVVPWDLLVPLSALPTFDGASLTFIAGAEGQRVRELFEAAGVVLAVPHGDAQLVALDQSSQHDGGSPAAGSMLHVRRPRMAELMTVAGKTAAQVTVTAVHRELVMDDECEELELPVRKSWNAKRRTDLRLSEQGALIGLEFNGGSSAAGAVAAASEATGSLTGVLESAVKGRKALDSLASANQERELADLARQVALAEKRLLAAGQAATAEDYARLARLKQAVEIAQLEVSLKKSRSELGEP